MYSLVLFCQILKNKNCPSQSRKTTRRGKDLVLSQVIGTICFLLLSFFPPSYSKTGEQVILHLEEINFPCELVFSFFLS